MFRFLVVFAVVVPGAASAAETMPQCLAETVNAHQVLVTGEYGGKPFAYTITTESPIRSGQKPPKEEASADPCPLTS